MRLHGFESLQVKPSVLHGDLWSGNIASVDGAPSIFDPATYYGAQCCAFHLADPVQIPCRLAALLARPPGCSSLRLWGPCSIKALCDLWARPVTPFLSTSAQPTSQHRPVQRS
jgi:hypothetical protein